MSIICRHLVNAFVCLKDLPIRFCAWFVRRRFVMGIASLIWLLYRSGLQPRRMVYPCQQVAAGNIAAVFGGGALLGLLTHRRLRALLRRRAIIAGIAIGLFGIAAFHGYEIIADSLAVQESAAIELHHLADEPSYPSAGMSGRVMYPSDQEALVAVRRAPAVTYGTVAPYDQASNPAYQLVWDTVAELGLGPADNPLRDLVSAGDTVIIKPNLESDDCTQAPMVRPIIDMCLAAGAGRINVGDGAPCDGTQQRLDSMGYSNMVNILRGRGHTQLYTVDFTSANGWSWIQLGDACAYTGSGYTNDDLVSGTSVRFNQTDSHGVNPNGQAVGWNAITDYLLDADVVINVPKLKVHDALVSTFAIKNWVGVALSTTTGSDNCADNFSRVCHWAVDASTRYDYGYGNDFMWRELANIHRATIYWKNGGLHDTPQRKYLVVTDGIQGVDNTQHGDEVQLGIVLAATDTIASSTVSHRMIGWDFRYIPLPANAMAVPSHPWGTNDPARIRVVGNPIDASFSAGFTSNYFSSYPEHALMQISDLTPPEIASVEEYLVGSRLDITVTTDADAAVVFLYYGDDGSGSPNVARMTKNATTFTMRMLASSMDYRVVAQDRYFNWQSSDTKTVAFTADPDVNDDGMVNILDMISVRNSLNDDVMSNDDAAKADVNADGYVNILDLIKVRNNLGL
ncbi:MAG: DUF362 domain-containing protein [Planctomycetes bacterium]|nr:DUF362 domain-containing protein [Planctomycetota bacterium]